MKKQILSIAVAVMMIGSITAGCSSEKKAGNIDSTTMDSAQKAKMRKKQMMKDTAKPAKTIEDTAKLD